MLKLPHLQQDVILAPYTTYQIGGPADYFVEVHDAHALAAAVQAAREEKMPYFVLGTGANILVTDKGFRGLVIHNQANDIKIRGNLLTAGSGATIADCITQSSSFGLSGLEHFVLIPSSVGGAIWQNLHFASVDAQLWQRSGELKSDDTLFIADRVKSAQILDEQGKIATVDHAFFEFSYDYSILHKREVIVLEVTFELSPRPKASIELQMQANAFWRRAKQPQLPDFPSCGSVFKKIEGVGAGRLVDQAGLKGKTLGGAQGEVREKTGYSLITEIGIIGER